jgi:hypothetical protein
MFHIYWENEEVGGKNTVGYCSNLPEGDALRWLFEYLYPVNDPEYNSAEMLFAEKEGLKYSVDSNGSGYCWTRE